MIYLIPDWHETTRLEEDEIYTLSKLFFQEGEDNKIVITNSLPFLRYKLNENGYSRQNVIRIFDSLQYIQTSIGHPVSLEDIPISSEINKVYTPNSTFLLLENKLVGTVFYNEYGFVSRCRYVQDDGQIIDDIYDDRGFISSKEYLDTHQKTVKIEYFNEFGEKTLTQKGESLFVEQAGNPLLKQRHYQSINDAINEILAASIENQRMSHDSIITTNAKDVIAQTNGIDFNGKIIQLTGNHAEENLDASKIVQIATTNAGVNRNSSKIGTNGRKYIPIFLPELNLGISDAVSVMKIYLKFSSLQTEEDEVIRMMVEKVVKDESIALVCEIEDGSHLDKANLLKKTIIEDHFKIDTDSDDYRKVEKYVIGKKEKHLFTQDIDAIKDIQQTDDWINYIGAVNADLRISYMTHPDSHIIEETFKESRVYLDYENRYNMLRHAKAVSYGIPVISRQASDFVVDGENGFIIGQSDRDIMSCVDYYLFDLRNWNRALVYNIDVIAEHEPNEMMHRWQEVISE